MIYDGLRVVDCTTGIAGAYCAKLLTDLGADVVCRDAPSNPLFTYLRTSQHVAAPEEFAAWVDAADVVIDHSLASARVPERGRPRVVVSITAMGHGGPDDGLDLPEEVLQARSGSLSTHGHMGQTPLTVGGNLGEFVTGAFAALGAAAAWRQASSAGTTETVDVSMLEAMQLTFATVPTVMARFPKGRKASFRFVMIPGNEPTKDGRYVGITTVTAQQWYSLLRLVGRDDLIEDEQLSTMLGRFLRADESNAVIRDWTTAHTADEVEAACVEARVPAAIVGNGAELPRFEQLAQRNVYVKQPGESWIRPRAPFRFHGVPDRELVACSIAGAPPQLHPKGDPTNGDRPALPFAGVRILDFTAFWAGPFATSFFAAMGADVIKVESVQRPDGIRFSAAVRPSQDPRYYEMSALFAASNCNKRGITLDLGHPDGAAIARQLVARSDVVVENFTPRVLEAFGFDYPDLCAIRPDIIMMRMPAFGLTGPWRDRPGFAQTMEQLTGMAFVTGYEGGPPIIAGGVVDPMVGTHAALALTAALAHRDRTGEGQLLEVPLVEVATAVTAEQVIQYAIDGELLGRRGEGGVYRCMGDDEWVAVARAADPLAPDERAAWAASRSAPDAAAELLAQGIPAAAMVPAFAALDDPQLKARQFFEPLTHPLVGEHEYPTWPMRFSSGPDRYWHAASPTLGQHNDEVLRELGCSTAEIDRLRTEHVIGEVPIA